MKNINKKQRILFLMQLYPPIHGASSVGEFIKSSNLINELFICDFIRISTISLKKNDFFFIKLFNLFRLYLTVLFRFLKFNYDLVYIAPCATGVAFYKDFGLTLISKLFCKKVVYHFHNKGVSSNNYLNSSVRKIFFHNASIIQSSKLLYYDIENYVDINKVFFLPYGILEESQNHETNNIKEPVIIYFAHMMREKGVFDLISICALLKQKGLNFHCKFVGGWYDISEIEFNAAVKNAELESFVSFLGPQYGKNKDIVLASSDIFAFPTYYNGECFPLSILEAMKMKLPVVTTNEGAIREIVDDRITGFVVEKRDINSFAKKLEQLLMDTSLRKKMGDAGFRKYESEYTMKIFESRLVEILNTVLAN